MMKEDVGLLEEGFTKLLKETTTCWSATEVERACWMMTDYPILVQVTVWEPIVAEHSEAVMLRSAGMVIEICPLEVWFGKVFTVVNLTLSGQTFLIFHRQEPVSKLRFVKVAGIGISVFVFDPNPISWDGALVIIENVPPAGIVSPLIFILIE